MKLTMTTKDRNLLIAVICAAIFVLTYRFMMVPGVQGIQDAQAGLAEAIAQKDMMEMQIASSVNIEDVIAANLEERANLSAPYFDQIWETRRIDTLVTDMILSCKLFPESMSLIAPQVGVMPIYSLVVPEEDDQASNDVTPGFVHFATVSFSASGSTASCEALVDAISKNPALHLNNFTIANGTQLADRDIIDVSTIDCSIQVIMCAEEADAL